MLNEILAKFGKILAIASPDDRPAWCADLVGEMTQLHVEPGFTNLCGAGKHQDFLQRLDNARFWIRLHCEALISDNDLLSQLVDSQIAHSRAKGWSEIEAGTATELREQPSLESSRAREGAGAAATKVPETNMRGHSGLPLLILKDKLTRELISPEEAWNELGSMPDDARYSSELRRSISNELKHLANPPFDVEEPAMDALRDMLKRPAPQIRREAIKILIDRISAPQEIKDYEASQRHAQRVRPLTERSHTESKEDEIREQDARRDGKAKISREPIGRIIGNGDLLG